MEKYIVFVMFASICYGDNATSSIGDRSDRLMALIVTFNSVKIMDLNKKAVTMHCSLHTARADYDSESECLFYAREYFSIAVLCPGINKTLLISNNGIFHSIAYDKSSKLIRYTKNEFNTIGAVSLDGHMHDMASGRVGCIAIPMNHQLLFLTKLNKVQKVDLKNNTVHTIYENEFGDPWSIAIDNVKELVYWTDSSFSSIQRCRFDGRDPQVVIRLMGNSSSAVGLAVHDDQVFFSSTSGNKLYGINVETLDGMSDPIDIYDLDLDATPSGIPIYSLALDNSLYEIKMLPHMMMSESVTNTTWDSA